MEQTETAEELLAKQHRKEKKELQGGTLFPFSTSVLFLSFFFLNDYYYLQFNLLNETTGLKCTVLTIISEWFGGRRVNLKWFEYIVH